jgi:hypothetical protein
MMFPRRNLSLVTSAPTKIGIFGAVQERYIMRQSQTFWLLWLKKTGKYREIADGSLQ